jgi:hypothetical protein
MTSIVITPDGNVRTIHDDNLVDLVKSVGKIVSIRRASFVEPTGLGECWESDLSPVGGPVLGPFERRRDALASEVAWLEEHDIPTVVRIP